MTVGYCLLQMRVYGSRSLKEKRAVVRSVTQRVRTRFNVAVAEVGGQETWQAVDLGIAYVSASAGHCHEVLEKAVEYIRESRTDAELLDYSIEIIDP